MNPRTRRRCRNPQCEVVTRRGDGWCTDHAPAVFASVQRGQVQLHGRGRTLISLTFDEATALADTIIDQIENAMEAT